MAFELARSAWIGQNVLFEDLPARNAQLSAAGSSAETFAFAVAGWLFQGLGAVLALAIEGIATSSFAFHPLRLETTPARERELRPARLQRTNRCSVESAPPSPAPVG